MDNICLQDCKNFFRWHLCQGIDQSIFGSIYLPIFMATIWNVNRKALWFHVTLKTMTGGEFWNYQLFHLTDPGYRLSNLENSRIILKNGVEPTMTFWTFDPVGIFSALLYFAVTEQLGESSFKEFSSSAHKTRSEEHTSELQSRETISYAVFCLKKKKKKKKKEKKKKKKNKINK